MPEERYHLTGRARWAEAVRQIREKSGPIYEKWLANYNNAIEREKQRSGGSQNARPQAIPPEID